MLPCSPHQYVVCLKNIHLLLMQMVVKNLYAVTKNFYSLIIGMRFIHFLSMLIVFGLRSRVSASKVLIYPFGHCLNSHLLNAEKLANVLSKEGHDVSVLISSHYNSLDHILYSPANSSGFRTNSVKMIEFEGPKDYFPICNHDSVDFMLFSPVKQRFSSLVHTFLKYCSQLLKDRDLLRWLKAQSFDVFVMESLDPCSRILADYLDIPFIPFITTGLGHWDGNFRPPSYLPSAISPFTQDMTFYQRTVNFLLKVMYETIPVLMGFDKPFEDLKIQYRLNTTLSIADTFFRAAIKLVNSNFAIEYPAPIEPDTILIGGFSVGSPKPLIGEFKDFVDSADDGVIVMSFGTLVSTFSDRWAHIFAEAFKRLPHKVIWKYKVENQMISLNESKFGTNIKLSRWIPQTDLLANHKTKLLITHCGLNSMYEASAFGVPVIAVPLSADQFNQAGKLTDHLKMGLKVDITSITSAELYDTIMAVLSDPMYVTNAKAVQARFHDQPVQMSHTISYWINYTVRHNGARHLKSPGRVLAWYQYFSVDVVCFILFSLLSCLSIVFMLIYRLLYKVKGILITAVYGDCTEKAKLE